MKDKLFILTNSVNPKAVGTKQPQVEAIYSEDVTYTSIGDHILEKLDPAEVILPEIKLKTPNAILTDYISNNLTVYPFQILISEKTLGILKKYTGAPHQIFNANLIHTKGSTRYYILHYLPSTVSYLDFQRSQFVRVYWTEKTTESFSAKNYQEFVNTPGLGGAKQVKALYLKSNIQLPDFFPVSPPGIFLVNEDIANAINQENVKGVCLIPFEEGEDFTASIFEKTMRIENPTWKGFTNA